MDVDEGDADRVAADPDKIARTGEPHPAEPAAYGRHQRGQPDRNDADHDRETRLDAGDIGQRRAGAVPQTIGDHQRHDRTRQQRQRDAGRDEGEIELKGHGGTRVKGFVMAGFIPAIHVLSGIDSNKKTSMPRTSTPTPAPPSSPAITPTSPSIHPTP